MRRDAVYLAVIAVLAALLIYAVTRALEARKALDDIRRCFRLTEGRIASAPRREPLRELSAAELLRPRRFAEAREEVDGLVKRALELGEFRTRPPAAGAAHPDVLRDACAQALTGGKRLRAVLVLEIARATGANLLRADPKHVPVDVADLALAVEYLHTSSLMIDDCPVFDNDAERRGQPAVWATFGPEATQLAALSMMTEAYQCACRQVDWIRQHCPARANVDHLATAMCSEISLGIGSLGAAGGQHMDTLSDAELAEYGPGALAQAIRQKTAPFYEIAFVAGWLAAGGSPDEVDAVRRAGHDFGAAFQIADDLGDMEQDAERRRAGKGSHNYALEYGAEAAERETTRRLAACRETLTRLGLHSDLWHEVYAKVWEMAD